MVRPWMGTGAVAVLIVAACSSSDTGSRSSDPAVADSVLATSVAVGDVTQVPGAAASSLEAPSETVAGPSGEGDGRCPSYDLDIRGTLPAEFTELSGWALSKRHPDVLWGHNDAGEGARLLAVSSVDGELVADVSVTGATSDDWEDVATYTDVDGQHWLLVADVGDNREGRDSVNLVMLAEPDLGETPLEVTAAGVVTVTWADGPHDVESLIVDPLTGDAIFVGKRFGDVREVSIDRLPAASLVPGAAVISERVGTFKVPDGERYGPTGGSISADGTTIGLVFYGQTMTWSRTPDRSVADTILEVEPCVIASGSGQYESIAIADDGTLLIATEGRAVPLIALAPAR